MTDRSADPDTPRPDDVRRSLRALADGAAPPHDPNDGLRTPDATLADPDSVVADAECAADCARKAASFLAAGRFPELDRAIATAARRGDSDVAGRGRAARESLQRLDAALGGSEPRKPTADTDATTSTPVAERF